MKVLKPQNHPPGSWSMKVSHSCGAELQVEETDLTRDRYSDARESWDCCEYKCPECHSLGSIQSSSIPNNVLARIKDKEKFPQYR